MVSVGDSASALKRRIINVADGVRDTDAATVGQTNALLAGALSSTLGTTVTKNAGGNYTSTDIGGTGQTTVSKAVQSVKTTADAAGRTANDVKSNFEAGTFTEVAQSQIATLAKGAVSVAGSEYIAVSGSNGAFTVSVTPGTIASGNTGLVTGRTVFTETRTGADGNYIESSNSAAHNLAVLDTQVKSNADAVSTKAETNASNIIVSDWHAKLGSSTDPISLTGDAFVTGAQVFAEVRPTDGNYVRAGSTTAANLLSLDSHLYDNIADVGKIKNAEGISKDQWRTALKAADGGDSTGFVNLNELNSKLSSALGSDDTKTTMRKEAVKAVIVKAEGTSPLTVETVPSDSGNNVTYTVKLTTNGTISASNAGIVTGGTVFTALSDLANALDTEDVTINRTAWLNKLKTTGGDDPKGFVNLENIKAIQGGAVASGETKLVSGGTVYGALNTAVSGLTAPDGTPISIDKDKWVSELKDTGSTSDDGLMTKNQVGDAISSAITGLWTSGNEDLKNAVSEVAKDAVKVASSPDGLVTVTPSTSGNVTTYSLSVTTKPVGDAETGLVTNTAVKTWTDSLTDGAAVAFANAKLVNGGLVFDAVKTLNNGALSIDAEEWRTQLADQGGRDDGFLRKSDIRTSINNAITGTDATQDAIRALARSAVTVKSDQSGLITVDGSNSTGIYKLGVKLADHATGTDGLMTLSEVKKETRITTRGNFISPENSAAQNLTALDSKVQEVTTTLSDKVGRSQISVVAGSHTTGDITTSEGSLQIKVNVADNGAIEQNNTGLVTGGTVWNYVKGFTTGTGFAAKDASNIDNDDIGKWITVLGTPESTGAVSQSNERFITGKEVAEEVRIKAADAGGLTFITADTSVKENLRKLDTNLGTLSGKVLNNDGTLKLADVAMSNLSSDGRNAVKTLAGEQITGMIPAVGFITLNGDKLSIKATSTLENDNRKLITSGAVHTAVSGLQTSIGTKADLTAGNLTGTHLTAWQTALGTGSVAAGNTGLITGGSLYTELRPANGTFVRKEETTAANLSKLDSNLGTLDNKLTVTASSVETIRTAVFAGEKLILAKTDLSNLTEGGKSKVQDLARDLFSATPFITANTEGNLILSFTDVITADADGSKLATDKAVKNAVSSLGSGVTSGLAGKADADAGNIDAHLAAWRSKLGGGSVASGNEGFVTGSAVYNVLLPPDGRTYRYIGRNDKAGENLAKLDQGIGEVYDRVTAVDTAWKSAEGLNQRAWLGRLSGNITANDADGSSLNGAGFVTGSQVYSYVTPTGLGSGTYLTGNTVGENLKALDSALHTVSQSVPVNAADSSLRNLTDAGKDVVRDLAKNAVSITGETGGLIRVTQNPETKEWTIGGISAGSIAKDNAGVVTGGAVWSALQGTVSSAQLDQAIENALRSSNTIQNVVNNAISNSATVNTAVNNALQNLDENTINNISERVTANAAISADDNKAVSGKTVYEYLHGANLAFGQNASVTGSNSIAIGTGNSVSGNNSGAFGDPSFVGANNAYSFGNNNRIEAGADGSFILGNQNTIQAGGKNTFVIGSNVTTSAKNAVILGAGSTGVDNAVSVGSVGGERRIVNVAPGVVAPGSTDAVNGDQLYSTQQAILKTNQSVNQVANKLHKEINRAAANAAAMAALQPLDLDDEHHWSAAAGVGNYSGEQALAVGVFYKPTQNFMVNMGASSTTHGDTMVNAGISYRFGAPSTYGAPTQAELSQKVVMLTNQNLALEAQLESARIREESMADRVKKSREELDALKAEIELMKEVLGLTKKTKARKQK